MFENDECETALVVEDSNVFERVNLQAAFVSQCFSIISTNLHNAHSAPVQLFVAGETEIPLIEGTM